MIWPQTESGPDITSVNKKRATWRHLSQKIVSPEILVKTGLVYPTWQLVEKKLLDCSTMYSQAVTHPSTNMAQCCLTSVIGRELVFST